MTGLAATGRRFRVALCDDAGHFLQLLQLVFEFEEDLEVVWTAANGAEAIERCTTDPPDVLLLDVAMPVMDGMAALPRILELEPTIRVVMVTGFDSADLERRALALGAAAFVLKGASPQELVQHVRRHCVAS
jgi:DNA-binding NarL/FixJ family response regulator